MTDPPRDPAYQDPLEVAWRTIEDLRSRLTAAEKEAAAAERERIRQLAVSHDATGAKCASGVAVRPTCQCATWNPRFPFADLLTEGDT